MNLPKLPMILPRCVLLGVLLSTLSGFDPAHAESAPTALTITPNQAVLRGQASRQQLLVGGLVNGRWVDVTGQAQFRSEASDVVQVDSRGIAVPVGDGTGTIVASVGAVQAVASFQVIDGQRWLPIHFERDVEPILTRAGCNAGACHGKARGQNGFQLSLLGFDREFDHNALVKEARGRRLFPAAPERSLLLLKPTGQVAHGGGKRLEMHEPSYEVLLRWIAEGAPRGTADGVTLTRIAVEPGQCVLAPQARQPLLVTAYYSDGSARDVTHLTTFQSNESAIAAVTPQGQIQVGPLPGEAAIMARFMEKFAVCNVLIPQAGAIAPEIYAQLPRFNFIDNLVWDKLQQLGIAPSAAASDSTFLRRAYLDVIGRLPTPEEARTFLADASPSKRGRLIEHLLERPEYADFWANKWADLLRPNPYRVGIKAVYNLDAWLRDAFRRNKPYDQFVRELLTAQGSTFRNGAVTVFRDRRAPDEIAPMVSQLFLGIRLECAKCHHHPFEVWSQGDFYSFAAYFARIGRRGIGLSPPISGGEEMVYVARTGSVEHPITGEDVPPRPLFGKIAAVDEEHDPRRALADWILAPDNPYFAQVIVNRVWADLMGRGLVEPVDDIRATNPASNGPLLEALAREFQKQGYDLKKLLRTIMTSYVYGLSSLPAPQNVADTRNYSRHYRQRLRAEVLLDAVCDITGINETFAAMPPTSRATQLWTFRMQSEFLDSFGRPDPNQDPPCERTSETTVVQALHLMNAPKLHGKVTHDSGGAARLAASSRSPAEIVDELYLLVYARLPTDKEKATCLAVFGEKGVSRRRATEDILWALLNTAEFVFKD